MDDVSGMELEQDFAPHGHSKSGGDDIVAAIGIRRIEADRIAARIADESVGRAAEDAVRPRITEVPCELARIDFDAFLPRRLLRDTGPASRAERRQAEEQNSGGGRPKDFQAPTGIGQAGKFFASGAQYHPSKHQMRADENDPG